jgi:hypothetical protein
MGILPVLFFCSANLDPPAAPGKVARGCTQTEKARASAGLFDAKVEQ